MIFKQVVTVDAPIDVLRRTPLQGCTHVEVFEFRLCEGLDRRSGICMGGEREHKTPRWNLQYRAGNLLMVSKAMAMEVLPLIFECSRLHINNEHVDSHATDLATLGQLARAFGPFCNTIQQMHIQVEVDTDCGEAYRRDAYHKLHRYMKRSYNGMHYRIDVDQLDAGFLVNPSLPSIFSGLQKVTINIVTVDPADYDRQRRNRNRIQKPNLLQKYEYLGLFRQLGTLGLQNVRVKIAQRDEDLIGDYAAGQSHFRGDYEIGEYISNWGHLRRWRGRFLTENFKDRLEKDAESVLQGDIALIDDEDDVNIFRDGFNDDLESGSDDDDRYGEPSEHDGKDIDYEPPDRDERTPKNCCECCQEYINKEFASRKAFRARMKAEKRESAKARKLAAAK
jgi:hypothetical protein